MFFVRAVAVVSLSLSSARAALVGHWPFDEGGGTAAANTANAAFPGTLANFAAGTEWLTPGIVGASALNADGVDDVVNTTFTGITGGAARSVSAWVKYPVAPPNTESRAILSYGANATGNRWTFRISGTHRLRLEVQGNGTEGTTILNDGLWHHVAALHSGDTLATSALYIDGKLEILGTVTTPTINTLASAGQGIAIGASKHSTTYNFPGGMDDVGFFNTALTPADMALIHALGRAHGIDLTQLDEAQSLWAGPAGGNQLIGGKNWSKVGGLTGVVGTIAGAWATNDFSVVLDGSGNGIRINESVPPVISSFTATPGNLLPPVSAATLGWSVSSGTTMTVSITPGVGDVAAAGTVSVTPAATTTYTLSATNAAGTATATVQVGVKEPQAPLQINEVMAANDGVLLDEDGDTPDWIELRNPNAFSVGAAGYRLRDGGGSDWVIPAGVFISANGHLRLFASGENRTNPSANLHTNFSLGGGGESLSLLAPGSLTVVDAMPGTVVFPDNVSWGRLSNGATFGYLATPTPGAANSGAGNPGPRIDSVTTTLPGDAVKPRRPAVDEGTQVADSIDQFSDTQGQNGWNYGWFAGAITAYAPASFVPFPRYAGQSVWSATNNFNPANSQWGPSWERALSTTTPLTDIGSDYMMPAIAGENNCAVRRWVSLVSGPAIITGFFHHVAAAGDGTRWQLYQNGTPLVDGDPVTAGVQTLLLKAQLRRFSVSVNLTAGDIVDMVCDPNSTETSDASRGWFRVLLNPPVENPAVHDLTLPVSATLAATSGAVSGATLFYRFDYAPEQSLAMTGGAGGVYTAAIPLAGLKAGQMIRWRIVGTDAAGGTKTSPSFLPPFDSSQYHGTVAADPALASKSALPLLDFFTENPSIAETTSGTRCSLMWADVFYDNLAVDLHATSSTSYAKKSFDVDLNQGHRFHFTAGGPGHTDVNILTNWRDRSKFRNPLAYEIFGKSGSPTLHCETVRLQLNGIFNGTVDLTGEGSEGSLAENGLDPNGALYKLQNLFNSTPTHASIGSTVEKRSRKWDPGSADLLALLNGMLTSTTDDDTDPLVNDSPRFRFLCDKTDVSATANWIAAMFFSSAYDWGHKNYMLYHDNDGTGRWQPFPWDLDLSFGHYFDNVTNGYFDDVIRTNTTDGTIHNFSLNHNQVEFVPPNKNALFMTYLEDPTLKDMIKRRLRTLSEQLLLAAAPAPDFEGRIDASLALLDPPAVAESDADLDLRIWGYCNQHQSGSFTCTSRSTSQEVSRIKDTWMPARRGRMFSDSPPLGAAYGGAIPGPETANPVIRFGSFDSSPASGNQDQEFIEITNASADYIDLTGWTLSGRVSYTFPPGTVIPPAGNTRFNGRLVVVKNLSAFTLRYPGVTVPAFGGYADNLSNSGERITLREAGGETILSFTYSDSWFKPAAGSDPTDGAGRTLVFSDPALPYTARDDSGNWRISSASSGDPGSGNSVHAWNYAEWRRVYFDAVERPNDAVSGPSVPGSIGVDNLVLFGLGLERNPASAVGLPVVSLVTDGGVEYAALTFRRLKVPLATTYTVQAGSDLTGWTPVSVQIGSVVDNGDQTESVTIRSSPPATGNPAREFMRLVISAQP